MNAVVVAEKLSARDIDEIRRQQKVARAESRRRLASMESPGRSVGSVAGSFVSDLAAIRQCVLLCWQCAPKFDPKAHGYVHDKHYRVSGKCDGCRTRVMNGSLRFFTHESYLANGGYRLHEPVR